jgi:Uma2 family endonuclease
MSAHAQSKISPEAYFDSELDAEFRNEYFEGEVYAMSGGSWEHAILIANLTRELGSALKDRNYWVCQATSKLKFNPGRCTCIRMSR